MPENSATASAGGSANELGSLHRSGFATVLAAHGLSGTPLDGAVGRVPRAIELETADAVDDIVCTMENGERWYVQAKRTVNDASLRSALRQWAKQPLSRDSDSLVLAVRTARGQVGGAMRVLEGRRVGRSVQPPIADQRHFEAFCGKVREECGQRADEILAHARIIAWEVEDVSDTRADSAATRLERLTSPGSGPTAFRCLQAFFQRQSAARTRTDVADWLQALTDGGLHPAVQGLGNEAAACQLEREALEGYRANIARLRDRLDLGLISPRVPVLTVERFIESVHVDYDDGEPRASSDPLTHMLRRNPRLIIRGLPGAGKSEAMRQIAAWLASDPVAPLPLLVRLRDIAPRVVNAEDVSLEMLVRTAARQGGREPSAELVRALLRGAHAGHCVFLLDGLDETYGKRGVVAAGIAQMLSVLSPDVGALITTRESAMDAAAHLALPVLDLKPPSNRSSQVALIQSYAEAVISVEDRGEWLRGKQELVKSYADAHPDIWKVPLLATLATLRVITGGASAGSAVALIKGVIDDSISRWEMQRASELPAPAEHDLNAAMLLDGFSAIGRSLNSGATLTPDAALRCVEDALAGWSLSPRSAEQLAQRVVNFWDATVGVFVDTGVYLQPRSRIFAELGDAFAAIRLDSPEELRAWLSRCLDDPARANALALASSENLAIARWVIEAARHEEGVRRSRAVSWLVEFMPAWTHLTEEDVRDVISALALAAVDSVPAVLTRAQRGVLEDAFASAHDSRVRSEGAGWSFAVALAELTVPQGVQAHKEAALLTIETDPDRGAILRALAALSTTPGNRQHCEPDPALTQKLEAALAYQLAEYRESVPHHDRFGVLVLGAVNEPVLTGLDRVAEHAARYASALSDYAIGRIWNIAIRLPSATYQRIRTVLAAAGHASPYLSARETSSLARATLDDFDLDWFVRYLAENADGATEISKSERWRMNALADFVAHARLSVGTYADMRAASRTPTDAAKQLFAAVLVDSGLDADAVHLEAADVCGADSSTEDDLASYIYTPCLDQRTTAHRPLSETTAVDLLPIVARHGRWASDLARELLTRQTYPSVCDAARSLRGKYWHNERNLAFVRLATASSTVDEAARLMTGSDGARAAAALYLAASPEANESLLRLAQADADATVRDAAGAPVQDVLAAQYWTCVWCYRTSGVNLFACSNCGSSSSNSLRSHKNIRAYVERLEANRHESSSSAPGE